MLIFIPVWPHAVAAVFSLTQFAPSVPSDFHCPLVCFYAYCRDEGLPLGGRKHLRTFNFLCKAPLLPNLQY